MITVYTDGGTVGANGKLGTVKQITVGIYCPEKNIRLSRKLKGISNNEAEFIALIQAMRHCLKNKFRSVHFKLDSSVVVNRANGSRPKGKNENRRMDSFQNRVLELASYFDDVIFELIPREENYIADELSNQAK